MKTINRAAKRTLKALAFAALALPAVACGPGSTVYVGVAAPGPWVGYPPGGVYGGYPGRYGRPWYSPDAEAPQERDAAAKAEAEKKPESETKGGK